MRRKTKLDTREFINEVSNIFITNVNRRLTPDPMLELSDMADALISELATSFTLKETCVFF